METTQPVGDLESSSQPGGNWGIVAALLLGWKTIGLAVCVSVALSIGAARLLPRWYKTTVEFTIIPMDDPARPPPLPSAVEGPGAAVPLFAHLLRSDQVIDEAVARHDLVRVYHTTTKEQARQALLERVSTATDRKAGIVQLMIEDRDPELARSLARTIGEVATSRNAAIWSGAQREYRLKLEARRDQIAAALAAAEDAMRHFREKEHILDLPAQIKATVDQATLLEGMRLQKKNELRFARHYASKYSVEVQRSRVDADGAQAALRSLGNNHRGPLLPWEETPRLEVEYARLKRDLDAKAAAYELVTRQVELLIIQETRPAGRTEIIEPATVPTPSTHPSKTLLVLTGALLGLFFGGLPLLYTLLYSMLANLAQLRRPK